MDTRLRWTRSKAAAADSLAFIKIEVDSIPEGGGASKIVYPQGCQEVDSKMEVDELIRRLRKLASVFQNMGQVEEDVVHDEFLPLCLHLAGEGYLNHESEDVKLLIACCIVDILRIYAPDAPYENPDTVKAIFKFLTSQLAGLKNPQDPAFSRYFYLLENLTIVKCFNMCIELEFGQDIFYSLLELIFSIVSEEHSHRVKSYMQDLLCTFLSESETVSNELLNVILANIVEPIKSQRKNAYSLARGVIIKCSETLEPYIQKCFIQAIHYGHSETQNLIVNRKVYDLIYELNHICPRLVLLVIPELELKLKSHEKEERLGAVSFLARIFSEKCSNLATTHVSLWQAFLTRFDDSFAATRKMCVQYSMHFLINHAELRDDITKALLSRQHDEDENIRCQIVKSIVATAKLDINIVSDSDHLLNCIKERTLDCKFRIRREALQGLGQIYKKHLLDMPNIHKAANWMKDRILHGYYLALVDDRILVERLLNTCLVPFELDPKERMLTLLYLYSTIDANSTKAFIEIQKNSALVRRHVSILLNMIRNHENSENVDVDYARKLNIKVSSLIKFLPNPVKASEFISQFIEDLKNDESMIHLMDIFVSPTTDCNKRTECVNLVLKKLGAPVMTNLYYNTIKILLERMSSVLIDAPAVRNLVKIMKDIVEGKSDFPKTFDVPTDIVIEKGLNLVSVLAFVFPNHFDDGRFVLEPLITFLNTAQITIEGKASVLAALAHIGKECPIGLHHSRLMGMLTESCQSIILGGTPSLGKLAVRCLYVNTQESMRYHTFSQIVAELRTDLDPSGNNINCCTAIIALGHIALLMPEQLKPEMKTIISQNIVKELLVNPPRRTDDNHLKLSVTNGLCEEEQLPNVTRCMIQGMKAVVRWLLGLKTDLKSAAKTFKMLTAFVDTGGEFITAKVPFSDSEKAWLRLTAGTCMLKICQEKGIGDQFTAVQFCTLSKLMNDEVEQVRSRFASKLHKGLSRGFPSNCLPLDFMGFYALAGYETQEKLRSTVRNYMVQDVRRRKDRINLLMLSTSSEKASAQLPNIMPDYMLVFAVPVLTHSPQFTSYENRDQLTKIRECLWFILEPLINESGCSYSIGFYTTLVERMKKHKNALLPEDEGTNCRLYAICDLALDLILQSASSFVLNMNYHPVEPRIPPMYFKRHPDPYWINQNVYLPAEMQFVPLWGKPVEKALKIDTTSTASASSKKCIKRKAKQDCITQIVDEHGKVIIDVKPTDAKLTRLEIPEILKSSDIGDKWGYNNYNENEDNAEDETLETETIQDEGSQIIIIHTKGSVGQR